MPFSYLENLNKKIWEEESSYYVPGTYGNPAYYEPAITDNEEEPAIIGGDQVSTGTGVKMGRPEFRGTAISPEFKESGTSFQLPIGYAGEQVEGWADYTEAITGRRPTAQAIRGRMEGIISPMAQAAVNWATQKEQMDIQRYGQEVQKYGIERQADIQKYGYDIQRWDTASLRDYRADSLEIEKSKVALEKYRIDKEVSMREAEGEAGATGDALGLIGTIGLGLLLFSDIRLKQSIQLTSGKYNDIGLNCYKWEWNEIANELFGLTGTSKGLLAQEVMIKYPMAVVEDSGYLKVNYGLLDSIIGGV